MNSTSSTLNALLIGVILVAIMYFAKEVLMPLALAGIFSFMLAPLVRMVQNLRVPRAAAVVLVVLVAFVAIFALGRILASQVTDLAADLPKYQATISQKIAGLRSGGGATSGTLERAQVVLRELDRQIEQSQAKSGEAASSNKRGPADMGLVPVEVHEPPGGALQTLIALINPLLEPLATTALIIIFVMFILIAREDLRDRLIRLAGSTDIAHTTAALDDAGHRLSHLFLTELAINSGFGAAIGLGLWWIGVPSAFVWGVLAGILRFIPFVGPVLGLIFPLILAVSVGSGWAMALWTIGLFAVLEGVTGQVIEPVFEGHSTGLSPIAIIVAASFWAWIWGPVGLVLATPLTVILVVLGRHVEALKFFDILLGDEPALSESQSLYQRLIAHDPIEAVEHAKSFIGSHSLSHYCDEVARPALALAQKDAERGSLDPDRVEGVRASVEHLFADIAHEHRILAKEARLASEKPAGSLPIVEPHQLASHWRAEQPFVSIGVRGRLDEAAAEVVATLARTHGIDSRVLHPGAWSPAELANLDLSSAVLICLSRLDTKTSAHIHYAARRIKGKAPHVKLLLGLWSVTDDKELESLRQAVGADYAAKSFHEAALIIQREATGASSQQTRTAASVANAVEAPAKSMPATSPVSSR